MTTSHPSASSTPKNCKRCKRIFNYYGIGHMYCPSCLAIDNEIFERIKKYLYEHGTATTEELSAATNVSIPQIEVYLREGRLEIPANSNIFIKCELCGAKLRSGRYCPACASKLSHTFTSSYTYDQNEVGEAAPSQSGKMHFLSKD